MHTSYALSFLTSPHVLHQFTSGAGISLSTEQLKAALEVEVMKLTHHLPDHYRKHCLNHYYKDKKNYGQFLLDNFEILAEEYLTWHCSKTLTVHQNKFEDWQYALTEISPLPVMAYKIATNPFPLPNEDQLLKQLICDNIQPHVFPSYLSPLLDHMLKEVGICDLHVHLNGSTPSDIAWLDALKNPNKFSSETLKAVKNLKQHTSPHQQAMQISHYFELKDIPNLVKIANNLRNELASCLFQKEYLEKENNENADRCNEHEKKENKREELSSFVYSPNMPPRTNLVHSIHPLTRFVGKTSFLSDFKEHYQFETALLVKGFQYLKKNNHDDDFAKKLHYYLLIQNYFTRFLVQHHKQIGFDQFQKITDNKMREFSEKDYYCRLKQFTSGIDSAIHIEGRFASKENYKDLRKTLSKIKSGLDCFDNEHTYEKKYTLSLVSHFIKKRSKPHQYDICWNYELRRSLTQQVKNLVRYEKCNKTEKLYYSSHNKQNQITILGIDAAANELHAPPEVFAPTFRYARYYGIQHATYHAGEDFHHLVSGIRAVEEAIYFLNLQVGDRIGHATAVGICPTLWKDRVDRITYISAHEWLDNLVFAHHYLFKSAMFTAEIAKIQSDIDKLSYQIYEERISPYRLYNAWQLRSLDPLQLFASNDKYSYCPVQRKEKEIIEKEQKNNSDALALFKKYHKLAKCYQNKTDNYEEVPIDYFTDEALIYLQDEVIKLAVSKKIAFETMLSSNVRISFYEKYGEHHILRWLGLNKKYPNAPLPIVCLGTDDPGIFSTTIKNECLHLLNMLQNLSLDECKSVEYIEKILKISAAYAFK